ncbi:MAG: response regulator transcription factor [Bacteroidetes bacterium]|nr:response regulator transcription factor [Bacteroidota bacterium]
MINPVRIILVDDHHIVRDGIKVLLMNIPDIQVVGEASSGEELMQKMRSVPVDILIMDICMPGVSGIILTERLRTEYPQVRVIMLTAMTSEDHIMNSLKAGAFGYLPKDVRREELLEAIFTVSQGQEYLAQSLSARVLQKLIRHSRTPFSDREENILTNRELEIIEGFAEGFSYKEIADRLSISVRTVETHKMHIMEKLGLRSIADMVRYAIKHGIIEV